VAGGATSAPGAEKVSKRTVAAGDGGVLLDLLAGLRDKAERRIDKPVTVVVIGAVKRLRVRQPWPDRRRDRHRTGGRVRNRASR